jgi:hypothetical protein
MACIMTLLPVLAALMALPQGPGEADRFCAGFDAQAFIDRTRRQIDSAGAAAAAAAATLGGLTTKRSLTYGTLTADGMRQLAGAVDLGAADHFVDLGSGAGAMPALIFCETMANATGVELVQQRAALAPPSLLPQGVQGQPGRWLRLIHGDLLDTDLSTATVVFSNSLMFPNKLLAAMAEKVARECPRLRYLLSACRVRRPLHATVGGQHYGCSGPQSLDRCRVAAGMAVAAVAGTQMLPVGTLSSSSFSVEEGQGSGGGAEDVAAKRLQQLFRASMREFQPPEEAWAGTMVVAASYGMQTVHAYQLASAPPDRKSPSKAAAGRGTMWPRLPSWLQRAAPPPPPPQAGIDSVDMRAQAMLARLNDEARAGAAEQQRLQNKLRQIKNEHHSISDEL